jgi:hypothetical protein
MTDYKLEAETGKIGGTDKPILEVDPGFGCCRRYYYYGLHSKKCREANKFSLTTEVPLFIKKQSNETNENTGKKPDSL